MNAAIMQSQGLVQARHWRIALVLGVASAVSILLLLPYLLTIMPQISAKIRIPLALFGLLQCLQGGAVLTLLAWAGLALGWKHQLDAPWLRAMLHAGASQPPAQRWQMAAVLGIAAGTTCLLLDLGFHWLAPVAKPSTPSPTWWQGLLASFYGGIAEETLCRLFVVSLLVWIGAKFSHGTVPGAEIYWAAIILAALLFGIAHLPAAAQMGLAATPLQIARIVSLNVLVGLPCGWLFWRYGLEHAMLAHFSADIALHVAAPLV